VAAKLANSIGRSNTLHKTYASVDIEAVRGTGQCTIEKSAPNPRREQKGDFVSTPKLGEVSTRKPNGALKRLECESASSKLDANLQLARHCG
jgi:hypothetical protein